MATPTKLDVRTLVPDHSTQIKNAGTTSPQTSPTKSSWRSLAASTAAPSPALSKMWSEPDWTSFKVRANTYLVDKVKTTTEEPLFELVWFDLFSGDHDDLLHICQNPKSFAHKAIAKFGNEMPQLFVVTLLIPGTPVVACVQYFALKKDVSGSHSEAIELWNKFLAADNTYRGDRLKLIPSIVDGPWIIKKSVGSKPVILAHALQMPFFQSPHYLEACVDICSDRVAKHVTSLVRSHSTCVKVDMGFVVEGQCEAELPERLLACVQYDKIDLKHAAPIKDTDTVRKGHWDEDVTKLVSSVWKNTLLEFEPRDHLSPFSMPHGQIRSSRQAKRLGKLVGNAAAADQEDQEQQEEEEEELEQKRPVNVGFAFLADSDSDESDDASEASEKDEEEEGEEDVVVVVPPLAPATHKYAKKKTDKQTGDSDDVDQLLEALASGTGGLNVGSAGRNDSDKSLFGVQLSMINADKEMKRIFGVKEVRDATASTRRVDPRNTARKTTKKVAMITPHDDWPRPPTFVGGGIRWTKANKPHGPAWSSLSPYFEITWSMAYKKTQEEFAVLQQTHDPNLIAHFLQRYPFHIDALLQMSEVFQHHGQNDHSADCIKRCMYVLELAWADQFDVTKGNCRMDIHTEHNDGFYKALFLLMKQVGRRGCMRSAFETAKMIMGLDPHGDPMNVLLAIDYYALSARQYQFVIDLYDAKLEAVDRFSAEQKAQGVTKKTAKNLDDNVSALPNIQLSLALAHHYLGNGHDAKEALARVLLQFPAILKPLLEKIAVNTSSTTWQSVLGSRIFANAKALDDHGPLQHVLDIYVKRNHTLWKVNEVQGFLLKGAQYAISSGLAAAYPQITELPPSLAKYKRSYPGDYSDEITTLPPDHPMLQPPQLPEQFDLNNLNPEQLAQLAELQQQAEEGNLPADANPLLLFLQTLLPWNRVQGAGAEPPAAPPQ